MELREGISLKVLPYTFTKNVKATKDHPSIKAGTTTWFSPVDKLPQAVEQQHALYIRNVFSLLNGDVKAGNISRVNEFFVKMKKYQEVSSGNSLPTATQYKAERINNAFPFATILFMAKPHIGVVTLIGEAHLEFFGSRDQIAKGKMQIVDGMDSDGILIAPADPIIDPYLPTRQMVMRFGDGAEIFVKDLQESKHSLTFTTNVVNRPITLPVPGKYNATNAMVAAYVGKLLAIADDDIVEALENIELTRNRTEWKKAANGADILSDVYNANPTAMRLILETFTKIPANEGGKKIAVLADMKELGEQSVDLHKQMIMSLSPDQLDTLIFYGEDIAELAKLASQMFPIGKVYYFKKTADEDQFDLMLETLQKVLQPADQVLLKGSNSMHLAKVVEALENEV